jgi:hypothetical protein
MNTEELSSLQFQPTDGIESMSKYFPPDSNLTVSDDGLTWTLQIPNQQELDYKEIGRILMVSGKCRNSDIKFILQCYPTVYLQLSRCWVNRLVWLERLSH